MRKLLLFALFVLAVPAVLLAQENPTSPAAPDWTAMGVAAITFGGGLAVTVATWLIKLAVPKVPAIAWPVVVSALGQAYAAAQAYAQAAHTDPLVGAAATAGALVIYGLWTTAQEQGTAPSSRVKDGRE